MSWHLICVFGIISLNHYLQIALWLYAGPSVTLSAWPTCVCVRPRDSLRNLNAFAKSLISSKLIPSTTLLLVWFIVGWSRISLVFSPRNQFKADRINDDMEIYDCPRNYIKIAFN